MTTPTTNYSWGKPVNGASADTWGTELNTLIDAIDTQVKANDTSAKNASSLSSGTVPDARLSGNLSSIAALTSAADRVPYYTGASTAQLATFTSFARSLVANADASSSRGTLGLGALAILSNVNDSNWSGAGLSVTNGGTGSGSQAGARSNLGIGNIATRDITIQSGGVASAGNDGDIFLIY